MMLTRNFAVLLFALSVLACNNKKSDALFVEDKESPYVNLVVSREDNKNEEKVKQFLQAFQSPEVEKAAEEQFKGGAVKGW